MSSLVSMLFRTFLNPLKLLSSPLGFQKFITVRTKPRGLGLLYPRVHNIIKYGHISCTKTPLRPPTSHWHKLTEWGTCHSTQESFANEGGPVSWTGGGTAACGGSRWLHHTSTAETAHTHTLVLPHQWGGTVSTAADTDRHTHHSPAHPTGHTPSLQFTPLLPTTTPTPTPLGRPSVVEMAVTVSPALLVLPDHQDLLVHPA